ncbi:solute carrier organic anion transporter family member 74D-like [Paramacrobiotus metropolitanus]|uniref:solute carrier organic anion transporter family member 74D-like n=1 Tax=Paramacrobiotus metropolitanus TaxID=2943436 RepID=UPI0024456E89|nr:solute carrier organic anion transporter family member 74D-like [Paramacrobiotus metropolitanus]
MGITNRRANATDQSVAQSSSADVGSASCHTAPYLRTMNTMHSFMGFFTALLVVYGMAHSYMSSVLPSIEKRFGFSSATMGIILAINDIGIVLTSLVTAHFGGKGHRPRGIFIGGCCCGLALLLFAAPEIFFPVDPNSFLGNLIADTSKDVLCDPGQSSPVTHNETLCRLEATERLGAVVVFGVAQFILGAASTSLIILGLPFIHDNVSADDAPIYFAISFFGRIFGPMLGFGLGAICNSIFLDGSKPNFAPTDPRWISAWYLGILITGGAMIIFSFFIGYFPPRISQKDCDDVKDAETGSTSTGISHTACDANASWKYFFGDLHRLVINIPFMCRAFSNVLDGMIITGFLSFFFKFIAQQYQLTPSVASLAGGVPTIFGIALGVVLGGLWIKKFHLQPRHVCLMLVLSALLLCVVVLVNVALGCERTEVLGLTGSETLYSSYKGYNVHFNGTYCDLSSQCDCLDSQFIPVCDTKSGVNFFSPCHAGCSSRKIVGEKVYYDNCTCVENSMWFYDDIENDMLNGRLVGGFCEKHCPLVYVFVVTFFIAMFCLGLPLSGSIMIQYRLVSSDLKAMSTGLISLLTSAFGYLPAPIFVGAVVDSTCRLWEKTSCGEHKFCQLYDTDQFRWRFLLTAACIKAVGAILDSIVTWKMWDVEFLDCSRPETVSVTSSPATSVSSLGSLTSSPSKPDLAQSMSESPGPSLHFEYAINRNEVVESRI